MQTQTMPRLCKQNLGAAIWARKLDESKDILLAFARDVFQGKRNGVKPVRKSWSAKTLSRLFLCITILPVFQKRSLEITADFPLTCVLSTVNSAILLRITTQYLIFFPKSLNITELPNSPLPLSQNKKYYVFSYYNVQSIVPNISHMSFNPLNIRWVKEYYLPQLKKNDF